MDLRPKSGSWSRRVPPSLKPCSPVQVQGARLEPVGLGQDQYGSAAPGSSEARAGCRLSGCLKVARRGPREPPITPYDRSAACRSCSPLKHCSGLLQRIPSQLSRALEWFSEPSGPENPSFKLRIPTYGIRPQRFTVEGTRGAPAPEPRREADTEAVGRCGTGLADSLFSSETLRRGVHTPVFGDVARFYGRRLDL